MKYYINNIKTANKVLRVIYKKCKSCNNVLYINNYYKNKGCVNNRESICKKCRDQKAKNRNKKICVICGKQFTSRSKNQIYCSNKCCSRSKENRIYFNCDNCGKESYDIKSSYYNSINHFCSNKCLGEWKSKKLKNNKFTRTVKYKCDYCGQEAECTEYKYMRSKTHYCSSKCRDSINKITFNCEKCGKETTKVKSEYNKSKHHYCSVECERKDREVRFGKDNNPSWNPNLTNEERIQKRKFKEYYLWRDTVFKRDKYTCQYCNKYGGKLNAHHLDSYNEFIDTRLDIDNGITLCEECHKNFHRTYGYGNNTREQYLEWKLSKYYISWEL